MDLQTLNLGQVTRTTPGRGTSAPNCHGNGRALSIVRSAPFYGGSLVTIVLKPVATATAGSDVVQSGRPVFDDFFQHLWPYIGNNTANVVFQMVQRLWLIRIDQ
ncbi:hypothetical protein TNCV_2552631 [Trichonephila clavipes]|nr:hypothetical protein TNCV_2552631 [Trichonephila clavipes]